MPKPVFSVYLAQNTSVSLVLSSSLIKYVCCCKLRKFTTISTLAPEKKKLVSWLEPRLQVSLSANSFGHQGKLKIGTSHLLLFVICHLTILFLLEEYVCDMHMCVRPCVWRPEEDRGFYSVTLHCIPSSQGLSLNLDLGWQPAGLSDSLSSPETLWLQAQAETCLPFYMSAGDSPKASSMQSRPSHLLSHLSSLSFIFLLIVVVVVFKQIPFGKCQSHKSRGLS